MKHMANKYLEKIAFIHLEGDTYHKKEAGLVGSVWGAVKNFGRQAMADAPKLGEQIKNVVNPNLEHGPVNNLSGRLAPVLKNKAVQAGAGIAASGAALGYAAAPGQNKQAAVSVGEAMRAGAVVGGAYGGITSEKGETLSGIGKGMLIGGAGAGIGAKIGNHFNKPKMSSADLARKRLQSEQEMRNFDELAAKKMGKKKDPSNIEANEFIKKMMNKKSNLDNAYLSKVAGIRSRGIKAEAASRSAADQSTLKTGFSKLSFGAKQLAVEGAGKRNTMQGAVNSMVGVARKFVK